ncbi:transmembrane protein [Legionella adelaidensis]|uniref:Transmembrane protein n=2 Tax=Legionella adelaidensis TaxID=45056 RepID=A0A0W0R109_9GAMM|nr:transmembrane protein [Legionella adelaidensis]
MCSQIMVGINIVFSKYVLATIPEILVLTLRFSLAALILLPLHWLSADRKKPILFYFSQLNKKDWFFIFGQALTAGILFNAFMLGGLHYTDANVAGIITSALPAIIALMCWLILREKITTKKLICVGLATLGLVVIASDKILGVGASHSFKGDILVFISLFPEATYYILSKMHPIKMPVFLISALLNAINAVILFFISLFSLNHGVIIHSSEWLILILLGLSAGLFFVFWFFGCQKVDGLMASLSTGIMPLATVIIAWVVLGEQLTQWQIVGMGMVILSIVVYAKR